MNTEHTPKGAALFLMTTEYRLLFVCFALLFLGEIHVFVVSY